MPTRLTLQKFGNSFNGLEDYPMSSSYPQDAGEKEFREMAQEFKLELNTKELEYKFVQFFISNFFLQSKFLVSNLFITTLVHFEIPFQGNDKQPKSS